MNMTSNKTRLAASPVSMIALQAEHVRKTFGPVTALQDVSLTLHWGKVHAVLGENGAGKSTLMKIFSGIYSPDGGTVEINGRPVRWNNPEQARAAGISTIFQEFILLPNLSVVENLFLGREILDRYGRLDRAAMRAASLRMLADVGLEVDPDVQISTLRVADQQMVEIAKGLMRDARIFIFDEPTAALGDAEVHKLFALIEKLRSEGKAILYISHRLTEIFELCDEVTVLKDGVFADHFIVSETDTDALVQAMVGREMKNYFPARADRKPSDGSRVVFRDVRLKGFHGVVNFAIGDNEIVGFAGLEGQGQIEITRSLYEGNRHEAGEILIDGQVVTYSSPADAINAGIGLIPEDRKAEGLILNLGVERNISLSNLAGKLPLAFAPRHIRRISGLIDQLNIKLGGPRDPVSRLSGGNQQKVLFARWLYRGTKVLICEEPTRGVDIGAKLEIYNILRELANNHIPVIVTSRELLELIGLCDRIIVIHEGATVAEIPGAEATEEKIMSAALSKSEHSR